MMFPAEWQHTVTADAVTTTRDALDNATTSDDNSTVTGVLFAPEGYREALDRPTIGEATLYGAFPVLDSDDTVTHADTCCDGSVFPLGTWRVEGGSKAWAPGKTVVPIRRAADV